MIKMEFQIHTPEHAQLAAQFLQQFAMVEAARIKKIEEQIAKEPLIITGAEQAEEAQEAPAKTGKRAKKTEATAATPAAVETAPAEAAASPSNPVTLEEVRAKLAAMSQAGQRDRVMELLGRFGATKLTDVEPSRFAELLLAAEVL